MDSLFDNKNIFVALTYSCNAFCEKCMTRYHINRNTEMSLKLLNLITQKLQSHQYNGLISVGSGEPLLYPHFPYFIDSILSVNSSISLRILSNGMLLNHRLPSDYFSPRCKWGITMDAFSQKTLSGFQYGVDIETVKNNIIGIVDKYGPSHLYLNYTLHNQNYNEFIAFCKFAIELGIADIYLTELKVYEGYDERLSEYRLKRTPEVEKVLEESIQLLNTNGISCEGISLKDHWKPRCFMRKRASPIIDVNGDVSFCSGREDIIIGNIIDDDIGEKWEEIYKNLVQNSDSWCKYCHSKVLENGCYSLPHTIDYHLIEVAKRST